MCIRDSAYLVYAPKGERRRFAVEEITDQLEGAPLIQGLVHGDGFIGIEHTAGGAIFPAAFRLSDRRVYPAQKPLKNGGEHVVVPGGYLALVDSNVMYVPIEGGARTLIRPTPGNEIVFFTVDVTAGHAIVWIETDPAQTNTIVYTSPLATTEATVAKRAVAKLPVLTAGVVNLGVLAAPISFSRVRLVRMSDGMGWDVDGETDAPFMFNIWVNNDFVWLGASKVAVGSPGFPSFGGMVRIPRPTTPPTIPNGL